MTVDALSSASSAASTTGSSSSSTTSASASQAKLGDDLNYFLNLLTTQLKNQDPLDPMDANQFTTQLVQFSSVEQQIKQNKHLEDLVSLQQHSQVGSMVNYIGTDVQALGNQLPLQDGQAKFTYALPSNAKDVTVTIQDAQGNTVFSANGDTSAGSHAIQWDGTNAGGQQQPDGTYTVTVSAHATDGTQMNVDQTVFGHVTGAGVDNGTVNLLLGDTTVALDNVLAVHEPTTSTSSSSSSSSSTSSNTSSGTSSDTGSTTQAAS